jgi:hypothetical protein
MAYRVLGVGAIGAAIVTGLSEDVDDAPKVLLSPATPKSRPASPTALPPSTSRRTTSRSLTVRGLCSCACVHRSRKPCSPSSASPPTGSSSARWRACR